jgi:23S rRNA G2069 N7-methylase RlmK/C1962 C5-methylase RlmI
MTGDRTAQHTEMLGNRLAKNARHLRRWAAREQVTAYRVYDRDIPEVPLVIDWYDGHLVIAARLRDDERERPGWLDALVAAAARALEVAPAKVFVKQRQQVRGGVDRHDGRSHRITVGEGELRFRVDLGGYLDTGLFLDHRPLRRRIRAEAAGRRFLNLFCYTGAFTVAAAAGGAASSLSLDLSNTYLDWAADNLALNQLAGPTHALEQADVLKFLADPPRQRFDLAVLDPPTFSTSKRMDDVLDVERDHRDLVERTLALMDPGAVLYFSTNKRRFRLDPAITAEDISESTIPPDFRDRKIHRCWRITR